MIYIREHSKLMLMLKQKCFHFWFIVLVKHTGRLLHSNFIKQMCIFNSILINNSLLQSVIESIAHALASNFINDNQHRFFSREENIRDVARKHDHKRDADDVTAPRRLNVDVVHDAGADACTEDVQCENASHHI